MIYTQIYSVKESFGYTIGKTKCIYIVVVKNLLRVFSFGYIFFFFAKMVCIFRSHTSRIYFLCCLYVYFPLVFFKGVYTGGLPSTETAFTARWTQVFSAERWPVKAQWEIHIQYDKKKKYFRRKCKITNITFGRLSKWKCVFVTVQRKDYSENLNRQAESLHVRVEVSQESVFKIRQTSDYSSLMTINACPAAPVHLWAGRPGAEENWRLCGQAEEAGSQRSSVATGDDHGGHGRTPAAEWHRVQGRDNEDSFVFLKCTH